MRHHEPNPLLISYQRSAARVPIKLRQWKVVKKDVQIQGQRNFRQSGRRASPQIESNEELKSVSKEVTAHIILPDLNTTVDGRPVKLLFRHVDSNGFDVNIIPLDQTIMDTQTSKPVPIVYATRFDLKNKVVTINGKKAFALTPINQPDAKVQESTFPQVFSSIGEKFINGFVLPTTLKSFRFLMGCMVQCLVFAATTFPILTTAYVMGYSISFLNLLPEFRSRVQQFALYYAPEIAKASTYAVHVMMNAASIIKGVTL